MSLELSQEDSQEPLPPAPAEGEDATAREWLEQLKARGTWTLGVIHSRDRPIVIDDAVPAATPSPPAAKELPWWAEPLPAPIFDTPAERRAARAFTTRTRGTATQRVKRRAPAPAAAPRSRFKRTTRVPRAAAPGVRGCGLSPGVAVLRQLGSPRSDHVWAAIGGSALFDTREREVSAMRLALSAQSASNQQLSLSFDHTGGLSGR